MPHHLPDPADIPVVILAGGQGMRLREETERVPKPMVRIGEQPILWHIMRHHAHHGFRRFMICLGYKSWTIKEYFLNYAEELADLRIDLRHGGVSLLQDEPVDDWEITLVESGLHSGSTGRLRAVRRYIDTPTFMYAYGDGVSTVDLGAVLALHAESSCTATITGVKPASRYGIVTHDGPRVTAFAEKPEIAEGYVSGGYFAMQAEVLDRLDDLDPAGFVETDLLPDLVEEGAVGLHRHEGFWHPMDTYRDFVHLTDLWESGQAPWRTWQ